MARQRRGGRDARVEARQSDLPEDVKPVRIGLSAHRLASLTEPEQQRIHQTVLDILSTIGLHNAPESTRRTLTEAGATLSADGRRILFSPSLVEDVLARCNRKPLLAARDPQWDIHPFGTNTYTATAGAAVQMFDYKTKRYHPSTLQDLYDSARICDEMEHVHYFQRTMVARDMEDPLDLDVNSLYACLHGTRKHIASSWTTADNLRACLPILYEVAGSEEAFRARPFASMSCCFVVPPLQFAEDACGCLEVAAEAGVPILLLSAGQAGATAPAPLALAIAQEMAECIAGIVYVEAVRPKAPFLIGPWPFVVDLRTGMMTGGSGEQALLMAGCGDMGRFYDLPTSVTAGMTDSKSPDAQSGYEKGYNYAMVLNSGANCVQEAAGMHASLLGYSHETAVLDNDALGAVLRTVRGIEVSEDNLSLELMRQCTVDGPGHFLAHDDTIARMQRDYIYPKYFDRFNIALWEEGGGVTAAERAHEYVVERLAHYHPHHIPEQVDRWIRDRYRIMLEVPPKT